MATGYIKHIFSDRGYGFIRQREGHPDVFFHVRHSTFNDDEFNDRLLELRVEFETEHVERLNKTQAINVRPAR